MVRHSNTWVFNIKPENWEQCAAGPTDSTVHGDHINQPWHGLPVGGRGAIDDFESGDLVLARRTHGSDPYGVLGIWEFQEAQPVDSQSDVPWTDGDYAYVLYCRPIQREFAEVYQEDFSERAFTTNHLQVAAKNLKPEHKLDYIEALLDHPALSGDVRLRLLRERHTHDVDPRNDDPTVWIEKTKVRGREYKQEGGLKLGRAILSPSKDTSGGRRYETLREAAIGDIVLHLNQDTSKIVGVSRIASELYEEFRGPPADHWEEHQRREGGYLRWLVDYQEMRDPIHIYDDVLNNPTHRDALERIHANRDHKIIYSPNPS